MSDRYLFVEPLLQRPITDGTEPPKVRYDETRNLTLLEDGTPLVLADAALGTVTMTKVTSEQDDADAPVAQWSGTSTRTSVHAEQEDVDVPMSWGDTQLDTRSMPADVERD